MADLEQLASRWEDQPQRWERLLNQFVAKTSQLEKYPQLGQRELFLAMLNPAANYRYVLAGNHKIIYRVKEEVVFIAQVIDSRSNPARLRS